MEYNNQSDVIDALAENYLEKPEQDLEQEYELLGEYNRQRFEEIPVDVYFNESDPYSCAEEMFDDIENNERLVIFSGGSHPEHLTEEENLKGRAVHDYFGHYGNRVDFSFEGEYKKWEAQRSDVPDGCESVLFAEVVGQTALVHYLEDSFEDDRFEQRSVVIDEELQNAVVEYMSDAP